MSNGFLRASFTARGGGTSDPNILFYQLMNWFSFSLHFIIAHGFFVCLSLYFRSTFRPLFVVFKYESSAFRTEGSSCCIELWIGVERLGAGPVVSTTTL